ncbi:MAG: dicarboxylate/amino acid:cation symporter [Gemmatimonadota bacterium]|nr:dicarboxylate/amino acid:cation symporter [Gemmatimonadota bacterium]
MNNLATAIGLVLGLVVGLFAAATDIAVADSLIQGVAPLGTLFINAIRMVVIPLVVTTIFVGVARLGNPRTVGKLGGSALGFFWGTTIPAIVIGITFMKTALDIWPASVQAGTPDEGPPVVPGLLDFLLGLIPANPFAAASEGALLALIVFTILVAAAAGALGDERRERLVTLAEDISAVFVKLIHWILWTAPVGVFGLTAPVIARLGFGLLPSLFVFVSTVVIGLFVFTAVFYLLPARFVGGKGIGDFIRGVVGTYTIGFSTTSSVASLPVMFKDADKLGVSPPVASLVLSLGAAINRAGSALFQGAALVLLAAISGVSLSATTLLSAGMVGLVVAMSVAPVPSASIVTLAPILETAGVPLTGLGILLGIDRIPDMFRSATNTTGHVACAVVVEGLVGGDVTEPDRATAERGRA